MFKLLAGIFTLCLAIATTWIFCSQTMNLTLPFTSSSVQVIATTPPRPATGPLRIHPTNPRYFTDGSGKVIYLTGSHTWTNLQNLGFTDPPPTFDYPAYLDWMQSYNHNFMRLWTWESAKGAPWATDDYWFEPLPYRRVGPELALDGKPKFDLDQFNPAYFDRLRTRVAEAGERGIYVSVMLFGGWSIDGKEQEGGNPWIGHPFNPANNINGINGDLDGDGEGKEIHTLQDPTIMTLQETYVRKVIDTLNDLDNVLWEISNESHNQSEAWQYHMIDYIKSYEAGKPKQHPVGMTVEYPDGSNDDLFASPADWISPKQTETELYMDDPPAAGGRRVIINDTDHLWGAEGGTQEWVWKSFLRGLNPIFMDNYKGIVLDLPPLDPQWDPVRRALGNARFYADRMNLAAMTPRGDLASTGYCLANPAADGAEYLVYLPSGGQATVDLSAASGELTVEWFDPTHGLTTNIEPIIGGSSQSFTAPFEGDAVLYISDTDLSEATGN